MREKDQARLAELKDERTKLYEEHKADFDFVNEIGRKAVLKTTRLLIVCLVALAVMVAGVWTLYGIRSGAEKKIAANNQRIEFLRRVANGERDEIIADNNHQIELLRRVANGETNKPEVVSEEEETASGEETASAEETASEATASEEEETASSVEETASEATASEEAGEAGATGESGETTASEEEPTSSEEELLPVMSPDAAEEEIAILLEENESLASLTAEEAKEESARLKEENESLKGPSTLSPMLLWLPVAIPVLAAVTYVVIALHRHEKFDDYHRQLVADMGDVSMRLFELDQEIEKIENATDEDEE